jgi:hypothetical protein
MVARGGERAIPNPAACENFLKWDKSEGKKGRGGARSPKRVILPILHWLAA